MADTRIMVWNILEGLHRPAREALFTVDADRLARAQRVVSRWKPDILVLNEALWCQPHGGYHMDFAVLFGFGHSACALYDKHWGNAILSRTPLEPMEVFSIHNRGGLTVRTASGLTVCTYHPHPSRRPHMRAGDYRAMLAGLSGPLVLCGDFNALDPADGDDRAALEESFRRFSSAPERDVARFFEGGEAIFGAMDEFGLRDALPASGRRHTIPTDLLSLDKASAMRLDHIRINRDVCAAGGEVIEDADAELASDHRPVVADLVFGSC